MRPEIPAVEGHAIEIPLLVDEISAEARTGGTPAPAFGPS